MTISVSPRSVAYTGNGATTAFAVSFPFFEIEVYVSGSLVSTADYVVTQAAPGQTGTVTFLTAPAGGASVVIISATQATQGVDLISGDGFNAESVERQLDRLAAAILDTQATQAKALQVSPLDGDPDPVVVPAENNRPMVSKDGSVAAYDNGGLSGVLFMDTDGSISPSDVWASAAEPGVVRAPMVGSDVPSSFVRVPGVATGLPGDPGATGPNTGLDYAFNTATAGDPGPGKVLFNSNVINSITSISISKTGRNGEPFGPVISEWSGSTNPSHKGTVRIFTVADKTRWVEFTITGAVSDNNTYYTVSGTAKGGTLPSANDVLDVHHTRTGNVGPAGSAASMLSVKDYGAIGNGVADDRAAIQAAINAASAAGGATVFLEPGTYKITQGLELKSNVHLMGAGPSSIIRPQAGSMAAQTISGQSITASIALVGVVASRVSNLKLDHATNGTLSNGVQIGHLSARSSDCTVEGIWIDGYASHQYLVYNLAGDRTTIRGCHIVGSLAGVPATDTPAIEWFGGDGGSISGNFLKNARQGIIITSQAGFAGSSCRDVSIAGNIVESCYDGIAVSAGLTVASGGIIERIAITGNVVRGPTNRGIVAHAGTGCRFDGVVISDNTVTGTPANSAFAISADAGALGTDATASGNMYYGTSVGFALVNAIGATLRGNKTRGATFYGVYVADGTNNTITGNEIVGCNQGVVLDGTPVETIVSRNDILEYAAEGVVVVGAASWINVSDNYFQRNTSTGESYAILAATATNVVVAGNRIGHTVGIADPISVTNAVPPVSIVKSVAIAVGTTNNLAIPIADTLIVSGAAGDRTITGIAGGIVGRRIRIVNVQGNLTLSQTSASSSAANRIFTLPNEGDLVLPVGSSVDLEYMTSVGSYWHVVGSTPARVIDGSVTNAKLASMATARLKGRASGGAGAPEDLTAAQAKALLAIAATDVSGLPVTAMQQQPVTSDANSWIIPPCNNGTLTLATLINYLYKVPLVFAKPTTITRIGIYVSTAVAGSSIRLGLRRWDGVKPTTLYQDCGTVDSSTTGLKEIAVSVPVDAGLVLAEFVCSHNAIGVTAAASYGAFGVFGGTLGPTAAPYKFMRRAFNYAALPADESAEVQTMQGDTNTPLVGVKTW